MAAGDVLCSPPGGADGEVREPEGFTALYSFKIIFLFDHIQFTEQFTGRTGDFFKIKASSTVTLICSSLF